MTWSSLCTAVCCATGFAFYTVIVGDGWVFGACTAKCDALVTTNVPVDAHVVQATATFLSEVVGKVVAAIDICVVGNCAAGVVD
jgi:hypothetical protein